MAVSKCCKARLVMTTKGAACMNCGDVCEVVEEKKGTTEKNKK